jgi:transposase
MEALDGAPASEVAVRYGVSRQSVYTWKVKYAAGGIDGLRDASRRPRTSRSRLPAETEALVCGGLILAGEPVGSRSRPRSAE